MRCLCKAADGERTALAQIDAIGIELENLLFAELLLHFDGNQHLRQFALDRLFRSQEESPGKLHGDGGSALLVAPMGHVNPGGLGQAQEVHAAVLKEAPVFDGQHRIHHQLRNLVVGDQLPLGPVPGIEQGSDHLRFEFVGRQIAGFAGDAFDFAAADPDDGGFLAVIGVGTGLDLDAAFKQAITAHGRFAVLIGIAGAPQLERNLFGFDLFAHLDGVRAMA